jgi:hypothetical protein
MLVTLYLIAAASWFGAVLWWWQFLRAMHESGTIRAGGQHDKPVAVSRPVPAGSYVRETPQGLPQAARPGEEMS